MARYVLPVVGAAVGAYFGGPSGAQAGFAIGSILGNVVDPLVIQGNKIGDQQAQTANEGGARAVLFGQGCISATTIIARGDRTIHKHKSGGKGGPTTKTETVHWTFAIGLGEYAPGVVITRIWQDEQLVYDITEGSTKTDDENAKFKEKFTFYDGNEEQMPDPALQSFLTDETPYFRGTMYIVFPQFDLTNTNERIPQFRFEVSTVISTPFYENIPLVNYKYKIVPRGSEDLTYADPDFDDSDWPMGVMPFGTRPWPLSYSGGPGDYGLQNSPNTITTENMVTWLRGYINLAEKPTENIVVSAFFDNLYLILINGVISDGNGDLHGQHYNVSLNYADFVAGENFIAIRAIDYDSGPGNWGWADFQPLTRVLSHRSSYGPILLADIVSALLKRAGMPETKYDVSELTDLVSGVVLQETVTATQAINSVLSPYFADPSEYDGKLHFIKRGKPVIRTLGYDDLTEEADTTTRENQIEYPLKVNLFYQSPVTGYAATKATSNRYSENVNVIGEASLSTPVTFADSDEPAQIAAKIHKVMWAEAEGDITWNVSDVNMDLTPADTIGLNLRGSVTRARITEIAQDGMKLVLKMRKDRQSAYTSNVTGIPLPTQTPSPSTLTSKSVAAIMDIPALVDSDDILGYYTSMSGETPSWGGAQLQRSLDGGSSWSPIDDEKDALMMGRLVAPVHLASPYYSDPFNHVKVELFDPSFQIDSISTAEWMSKGGAFALQNADGLWEILQYRDAVEDSDGHYTLTMLQRGRLNTSALGHDAGGLFVMLSGQQLAKIPAQSAWIGKTLRHRAISYSTSPEDAVEVPSMYNGYSQREWSPASFNATYDGVYVRVTDIVPRHRFGTEMNPIPSVNFSGYRVTATDGASVSTVDIDGTALAITLDVSAFAGPVTQVSVAAMNRLIGPGDALVKIPSTIGYTPPIWIINGGTTGS